jgi:hypothetical protein
VTPTPTPAPPAPVVTGTATDTTAAAFGAGTRSGTYVSARDGGEVVLTPGSAQELSGTALPAGWTSTSLGTGSSVTVTDGTATVSGRFVRSAVFTGSREADAVATLRPVANQALGLTSGGDFATTTNRWAAFRTTAAGGLVAETRYSATGVQSTALPATLLGTTAHRWEVDWSAGTVTYSVDGTVVATHARAITGSMAFAVRDQAVDANPVVLDSVWFTPYAANGTFTSKPLDAGAAVEWGTLAPAATTPAGTGVTYQVRTGATATPGTGWSAWTTVAPGADVPGTTRYLQYRATLTSTATRTRTPTLSAVSVGYTMT